MTVSLNSFPAVWPADQGVSPKGNAVVSSTGPNRSQADHELSSDSQADEAADSGTNGGEPQGLKSYCWDALQDLPYSPPELDLAIDLSREVQLDLQVVLGRSAMRLEDVLKLRLGSAVILEQQLRDPVEVHVNGRLVAYGEVLVLDGKFCIRVIEMVA
jgi:flagellar motor switch protein FliN/FliY